MEENVKNAISAMRERIVELENRQKEIKPQRKTVNFKGERTINVYDAAEEVKNNKHLLRMFYAAYGLLRGKGFERVESAYKPLIYDPAKYWAYPEGCKGQRYTRFEELNGKHPLCAYLSDISSVLNTYDCDFKNYETEKDRWGTEYRTVSLENYEEVVCFGE
jgi:hypothetical protein